MASSDDEIDAGAGKAPESGAARPRAGGRIDAENGQVRDRKSRILNRLRRLEGQVRGLQRMVGEERSCQDSLTLLAGIRSALDAAGDLILEDYLENCAPDLASGDDAVAELVRAVRLARG
jgi:DNA-binding FrmR family transcriptional regulator